MCLQALLRLSAARDAGGCSRTGDEYAAERGNRGRGPVCPRISAHKRYEGRGKKAGMFVQNFVAITRFCNALIANKMPVTAE